MMASAIRQQIQDQIVNEAATETTSQQQKKKRSGNTLFRNTASN